jgi:MFS family permease
MIAQRLADRLNRRGVHYGWVVIATTFFTGLVTAGAVGLPGAFIRPLGGEFGWDTAQISGALAVRFLLFGLMAPFSAALIERYGVRRIVTIAITMLIAGLSLATVMTQLWQLFILWGLVLGVGSGMTALVLGATMASRWFTARRGLVLGMLTAAISTGQLVFLPLASWLIEHMGWRAALLPSIGALAVAGLLVILFLRDRPSDIGLAPYGETAAAPPASAAVAPPAPAIGRAFTVLAEGARHPAFWILFGTFFVCGLSTNGLIQTHFISLCGDYGMSGVEAASMLAMMGCLDIIGTIGSGYLSDRYDNRWLLFWYYGLRGLSLLWLPFSSFSFVGLSVFVAFYGLDWIATVPPTVKLAAQIFGRERASVIFGWIFTGHQIGAAIAAFGGGFTRTAFGSYLPAFFAAGAICLIAAGLILLIGRDFGAPQRAKLATAR